jgi:hypothetical protein
VLPQDIEAFEYAIVEKLLKQFVPGMFNRIELGSIARVSAGRCFMAA